MSRSNQVPSTHSKDSFLRNQSSETLKQYSPPRYPERHPVEDSRKVYQQSNLTNKYYLAGTARNKLAYEAEEVDLNLLRLVGHANFLDRLQDEIEDAEKLHETRYQAHLVQTTVTPKKGGIQWADTKAKTEDEESESSDDEDDRAETSSDSEGEEEILELVRVPTRYQLTKQDKMPKYLKASKEASTPRHVKVVQVSSVLPKIAEEDEAGVEALVQTFDQGVVVGVA